MDLDGLAAKSQEKSPPRTLFFFFLKDPPPPEIYPLPLPAALPICGHCQPLTIPPPPRAAGPAISQDQRWALAARLLRDATLDPTDRVAGCLLLLYGQPLSRRSEEHTSELQSQSNLVCRLLLEKKNK